MRITLVTGGARSGKTRHALALASAAAARLGSEVSYLATAASTTYPHTGPPASHTDTPSGTHPEPPSDPEMARRIARHRAERPASWETLEPGDAPAGDAGARAASALLAAQHPVILLDCLTLLLTGAILGPGDPSGEEEVETRAGGAVEALLAAAATRTGELFVVTNEVGMGIVPLSPLGRWFRDAQGRANQRVAAAAEEVVLLVSGIPVQVK